MEIVLVSTTLAVQDLSQLKKNYGKEQAEVIMNIVDNVISGQVMGETADQLSKRFGRINQDKESFSLNSVDTSISRSKHLDLAIPASTISTLSSEEFVGMVADDLNEKISLKIFHSEIINLKPEEKNITAPAKIREVSSRIINIKYVNIKKEIEAIVQSQLDVMINSPELLQLMVRKKAGL